MGKVFSNTSFPILLNLSNRFESEMSMKLWFISEDDEVIRVYDDYDQANEELFYLKEENPEGRYKGYGLLITDLGNYDEELELAISEGFIAE